MAEHWPSLPSVGPEHIPRLKLGEQSPLLALLQHRRSPSCSRPPQPMGLARSRPDGACWPKNGRVAGTNGGQPAAPPPTAQRSGHPSGQPCSRSGAR